jgi:hypothetical protein
MPTSLPAAFSRNAVAPATSPNRVRQFIAGRPQMIASVQVFSRISRTASNVDTPMEGADRILPGWSRFIAALREQWSRSHFGIRGPLKRCVVSNGVTS